MDRRSTTLIALVIFVAIIGFIYISFQRTDLDTKRSEEIASTTRWMETPAELPSEVLVTPKTVVTAKHAYQNGKHIIAGEIPLPTACHILESSSTVSTDKKQILIALVSSVKSGEVCAQVITPARFKLTIDAKKDAKIQAFLNGQEVTLNLIEAGPNENLDDFELYMKG